MNGRPYHPTVEDMTEFQDRTSTFQPASHKGRTQREKSKNQKRVQRRIERDSK